MATTRPAKASITAPATSGRCRFKANEGTPLCANSSIEGIGTYAQGWQKGKGGDYPKAGLDREHRFCIFAPMKFLVPLLIWIVMGAIIAAGIVMAVGGHVW